MVGVCGAGFGLNSEPNMLPKKLDLCGALPWLPAEAGVEGAEARGSGVPACAPPPVTLGERALIGIGELATSLENADKCATTPDTSFGCCCLLALIISAGAVAYCIGEGLPCRDSDMDNALRRGGVAATDVFDDSCASSDAGDKPALSLELSGVAPLCARLRRWRAL